MSTLFILGNRRCRFNAITLPCTFALLLQFGCSSGDGGEVIGTKENPITSDFLADDFRKGLESVKKTYVGKTVIVRGKIGGLEGGPGQPGQVVLVGQESDPATVPWITCRPKESSVAAFEQLKLGDIITASGVAHHVGKSGVFLRDCNLIAKTQK